MYKIGDRVRTTEEYSLAPLHTKGTIRLSDNSEFPIAVDFDNGHYNGFKADTISLEPLPTEEIPVKSIEAGDRVRVKMATGIKLLVKDVAGGLAKVNHQGGFSNSYYVDHLEIDPDPLPFEAYELGGDPRLPEQEPETITEEKPVEQKQVFEVGGFLEDANGVMHPITELTGQADYPAIIDWPRNDGAARYADPAWFKYHPPVKPITIKPGDPLWEALAVLAEFGTVSAVFDVRTAWQKAKEAAK